MKISKEKYEIALSRSGLTSADVNAAGVPNSTICRAFKNGGEVRPSTAGKLAKALGVDVMEIIETE